MHSLLIAVFFIKIKCTERKKKVPDLHHIKDKKNSLRCDIDIITCKRVKEPQTRLRKTFLKPPTSIYTPEISHYS